MKKIDWEEIGNWLVVEGQVWLIIVLGTIGIVVFAFKFAKLAIELLALLWRHVFG